ncbi:MAG: toxin-antitoxin (TA) system antitoxin [Candidatus Latescibacteria bacterium]|jgi:antitoxin (DNA-binding transcriptional repressor) of toxin-antitoxin stability system|nr:toxin-antitoxin (TA) system antitoxin [Candidatus Latescibacterota bacterium]
MASETVDIREVQSRLKELLSLMDTGTDVILVEDNTPVARLVPVTPDATTRIAGLHEGASWTSEDFDAPLPDAFWTGDQ